MSKMSVTRHRWHLFYTYALTWRDAYWLSEPVGRGTSQPRRHILRREIKEALDALAPVRILGIKRPACLYERFSRPMPFSMMNTSEGLVVYGYPPTIWLARRGDAILLKLSHG